MYLYQPRTHDMCCRANQSRSDTARGDRLMMRDTLAMPGARCGVDPNIRASVTCCFCFSGQSRRASTVRVVRLDNSELYDNLM